MCALFEFLDDWYGSVLRGVCADVAAFRAWFRRRLR